MAIDPAAFGSNPDVHKLIAQMIDLAGRSVMDHLAKLGRTAVDKTRVSFLLGFDDYLKSSYEKCRFVKTILSPDIPTPTDQLYVNVALKSMSDVVPDDDLIDNIDNYRSIVITGSAGSGKSWFMKHLILRRFGARLGKIPLFIELRHLNGISEPNILTFIATQSGSARNAVTQEQFELALAAGSLLLVLDGFDEIEHSQRDTIERQILDIRRQYPSVPVVVSSRFDERFGSWEPFFVFQMEGLSQAQVTTLIRKLDFDSGVKEKFVHALGHGLYERHKTFLSYPLLVTIMLMTYRQYAEIADKISVFYEQAFETLYLRHDAMKDQFKRRKYTDLAIDDFRDCFAIFCATSYIDEKFSFTARELRAVARIAVSQASRPVAQEDFIKDLLECVCMLQQDGLNTSFVHRSFQEYFTAVFCAKCNGEDFVRVVDRLVRRNYDSVLPMLLELATEKVEQE